MAFKIESENIKYIDGFTIQLYLGGDRTMAEETEEKINEIDSIIYRRTIFTQPNYRVKVGNYYGASIKEAKKEAAFAWLRNNGFGDMIKNQVSCSFGRDEDEKARGLIDTLNEKGYPSSQREWVEPSTLRAFIREQHEAGKELPMDLLGAFVGQKTTIKN